ncbi:hypothetical protein [Streptomyces violens]|uniref:hypothetical protein n=1 Tax=Streptomyces violens TaxID=66377 RepID=UPI00068E2D85|nr:hypothetical protein [Streptomyces violens]
MGPDEDDVSPSLDACDACGRALELTGDGDGALLAVVADSSANHVSEPQRDGQRMVLACSRECMGTICEKLRRRPFISDEMWAGKIVRAVREHHSEGRSLRELEAVTGLEAWQAEAGMRWIKRGWGPFGPADGPGGSADGSST